MLNEKLRECLLFFDRMRFPHLCAKTAVKDIAYPDNGNDTNGVQDTYTVNPGLQMTYSHVRSRFRISLALARLSGESSSCAVLLRWRFRSVATRIARPIRYLFKKEREQDEREGRTYQAGARFCPVHIALQGQSPIMIEVCTLEQSIPMSVYVRQLCLIYPLLRSCSLSPVR
jgi:hypothetical protein